MDPEMDDKEFDAQLAERFKQLPKAVQDAITSADVEDKLRSLSEKHKLHLDQWGKLENEVMLTLFGFQPAEDLEKNLEKEVGIAAEASNALTLDIGEVIFRPIREALERETESPSPGDAPPAASPALTTPLPPAPPPVTPPPVPAAVKVERAPTSPSYAQQTKSHERPAIEDDPYREPIT